MGLLWHLYSFSFLSMSSGEYRMALPIEVHDGTQTSASQWLDWSYTALHLFDISVPSNVSDALMSDAGVIVAERKSDLHKWPNYVDTQRGIIDGDAVHYVYGTSVISTDWNYPGNTSAELQ